MANAIQIEGLTKTYKGKKGKVIQALKNLSLTLNSGDTFGFIGPNGAGKTTAIKILAGLAFATGGKANIFGEPVSRPETRRFIGYLPELSAYSPVFEAQELLEALGMVSGMTKNSAREKGLDLLRLVGLEERKKSRLGEYSKGMLQRFGIAQALLHDPKILILDEPTSGLDPIAQREVLDILRGLKSKGITIFFSSHRLVEVEGLCDFVGIISLGEMIFHGTLSQLQTQEDETPYLIRYSGGNDSGHSQRTLDGSLREIAVFRPELDKTLAALKAAGATVITVNSQRSPLEDTFVRMITRHQGGRVLS